MVGWTAVVTADPIDANGYYQSRIDILKNKLQQNPQELIPCRSLNQFQNLYSFQVPATVQNRISALENDYTTWFNNTMGIPGFIHNPLYIQDVNDADGTVLNFDYFPIKITQLPVINQVQWTPYQLLDYFRKNINLFINNNIATFAPFDEPWVNDVSLWNSTNPLGALLHLDMAQDGSVIVSDYNCSSSQLSNNYNVSTLVTPLDGFHPVSGNRSWGIQYNTDPITGEISYTFYTTAVDRITTNMFEAGSDLMEYLTQTSGFTIADNLWHSRKQKMVQFVQNNNGSASYYDNGNPSDLGAEIRRPQWDDIKKFLRKQISYEELRISMGCP